MPIKSLSSIVLWIYNLITFDSALAHPFTEKLCVLGKAKVTRMLTVGEELFGVVHNFQSRGNGEALVACASFELRRRVIEADAAGGLVNILQPYRGYVELLRARVKVVQPLEVFRRGVEFRFSAKPIVSAVGNGDEVRIKNRSRAERVGQKHLDFCRVRR